jgi:hypothetical protein
MLAQICTQQSGQAFTGGVHGDAEPTVEDTEDGSDTHGRSSPGPTGQH